MDGRTDRRTDGLTDDSYFIGRCPTNAKRPTEILDQGICICIYLFFCI